MARGVRVTVMGLKDLHRNVERVKGAQARLIEDALMVGALPLETRWKELAPVDTGTYRRSIHREIVERSRYGAVLMVGTNLTDPPYPEWLEYGTRRMAPRPSARPAYDETRDEVTRRTIEAYRNGINRLVGR